MADQVKETTENQNPLEHLGEHGINGGPGRPKGSKNKYTLIKEELAEVWEEEKGKERFRALFNGTQKDFIKALEFIVAILPKEPPLKVEQENPTTIVYYRWNDSESEKQFLENNKSI